jgi:hypothetical protein
MKNIPLAHLIVGLLVIAASIPLILRKVPMNAIYGIRIPAAFESDARWYDINAYGAKLTLLWGLAIVLMSLLGFTLPERHRDTYAALSPIPLAGGLLLVLLQIMRKAKKRPRS